MYKDKYLKNNICDVVDMRDFIFNSKAGGLVIKYKNKECRVPYIYPFVDLVSRANINSIYQLEFSLKILKMNIDNFENESFKIKEMNDFFIDLSKIFKLSKEESGLILIIKIKEYLEKFNEKAS